MVSLPVFVYFVLLSFLASLLVFKDKEHPYLKFFPPFLLATIITEIIAYVMSLYDRNNILLYNFFTTAEFCFYLFFISILINNESVKKIIRIACVLYLIPALINIFFFQGPKVFHTVTYSFGCLLVIISCFYYFLELFRLPKSVKLSRNPAFWICSGLLFFYCCGFPLYAFVNFWLRYKWMLHSFQSIISILNIFLYSLFTIAFLCNKIPKSTSSSS